MVSFGDAQTIGALLGRYYSTMHSELCRALRPVHSKRALVGGRRWYDILEGTFSIDNYYGSIAVCLNWLFNCSWWHSCTFRYETMMMHCWWAFWHYSRWWRALFIWCLLLRDDYALWWKAMYYSGDVANYWKVSNPVWWWALWAFSDRPFLGIEGASGWKLNPSKWLSIVVCCPYSVISVTGIHGWESRNSTSILRAGSVIAQKYSND